MKYDTKLFIIFSPNNHAYFSKMMKYFDRFYRTLFNKRNRSDRLVRDIRQKGVSSSVASL